MILFWIVPYSLIGGKWLRYTLSLMPFVYMLAAVGVVAFIRFVQKRGTKAVSLALSSAKSTWRVSVDSKGRVS